MTVIDNIFIAWIALMVGIWIGSWLRDRKWQEKGKRGYPCMYSGGELYWVNWADKPCYRCTPQRPTAAQKEAVGRE